MQAATKPPKIKMHKISLSELSRAIEAYHHCLEDTPEEGKCAKRINDLLLPARGNDDVYLKFNFAHSNADMIIFKVILMASLELMVTLTPKFGGFNIKINQFTTSQRLFVEQFFRNKFK